MIADTTRALAETDDEQTRRRLLEAQGWAFVLAAKLASKLELPPTARVAAERAMTAASYASSPVLQGAATSQLAEAFAGSGETAHAEEVAVIGADHLAILGRSDPAVTSVRGALLLAAASSTAAGGDGAQTSATSTRRSRWQHSLGGTATTAGQASVRPTSRRMPLPPPAVSIARTSRFGSLTESTLIASRPVWSAAAVRCTSMPLKRISAEAMTPKQSIGSFASNGSGHRSFAPTDAPAAWSTSWCGVSDAPSRPAWVRSRDTPALRRHDHSRQQPRPVLDHVRCAART